MKSGHWRSCSRKAGNIEQVQVVIPGVDDEDCSVISRRMSQSEVQMQVQQTYARPGSTCLSLFGSLLNNGRIPVLEEQIRQADAGKVSLGRR